MDFPQDQIEELKKVSSSVGIATEGGYTYILLEKLRLPEGCVPVEVDALLCPMPHTGYLSRLFFAEKINGGANGNWNGNIRVLDRNWFAISWQTNSQNISLIEKLMIHLKPFNK